MIENNMTKEECLDIISSIKNPQTKDEKFKYHLAITYIRENFKELENKDLKTIIDNENFVKKLGPDHEKKLIHRYTNFNLKIFNKEQCIDTFTFINNPKDNNEKYKCHLSLSYFKENILSFSEKELKNILANDYVKTHAGKKFDAELMSQCIKNNKSLPMILPSWSSSSIPKPTLDGYLNIIHDENNLEQLQFFCNNRLNDIANFIHQKKYISDSLAKLYLKIHPPYIYELNWTEEKACAWLDENPSKISELFHDLYLYEEKMGEKFTKKIYDNTVQKLFVPNHEFKDSIFARFVLTNNNNNFLKYLKKNHSPEFKELLATEIEHLNRSDMKLNIAQYLIDSSIFLDRDFYHSAKTLLEIIVENKELLLKPIKLQTRLYERESNFFEHALNTVNFLIFSPFNLNDVVEDKHKEPIIAAAFCLLQAKHEAFDTDNDYGHDSEITNYEYLKKWYPQIIDQATSEQIIRYCDKALKGNESNSNLTKELNMLKLKVELNQDLKTQNLTSTARLKI